MTSGENGKKRGSVWRLLKGRRFWSAVLATGLVAALLISNNGILSVLQQAISEGDPLQRIFSILENAPGEPTSIADYEQLANIAITQERYDEALQALDSALELAGDDDAVRGALLTKQGSVHALMQDYDAAKDALSKALAIDPKDAQALILRAQIGIDQGDYAEAVKDLEGYLAQEDQDASIWTVMAQLYEAMGDYDKARESYEKAYQLDPESIANVLNSARNEYLLGNYEAAIQGYDAYLSLEDDADGTVHFLRGVAYMQLAEYQKAAADLEQAIERGYAERALSYEQLSICYYALEDYERVLSVGEEALEDRSDQITYEALYQRMGVAAMSLERYEEALRHLDESLALNEALEGTWYYRGVCHLALERYEDAIEDFTKSIDAGFLLQFCYYNRGVCYVQLGQYDPALDDMEKTLTIQDGDETLFAAAKDVLWQIAQYYMTNPETPPSAEAAHEVTDEMVPEAQQEPQDD